MKIGDKVRIKNLKELYEENFNELYSFLKKRSFNDFYSTFRSLTEGVIFSPPGFTYSMVMETCGSEGEVVSIEEETGFIEVKFSLNVSWLYRPEWIKLSNIDNNGNYLLWN